MTLKSILRYCIVFIGGVMILSSCDFDRNSPGHEYAGEMANSLAYESWTENSNFTEPQTMQLSPKNTISTDMSITQFKMIKGDENRLEASQKLQNPISLDSLSCEEGQKLYNIYCINCHGIKGDGQGNLFVEKKYPYPPASLLSEKIRNESDGGIYQAISVGYGVMSRNDYLLTSDQRWNIINYIKGVLQKETK